MDIVYFAEATSSGDARDGRVQSADGQLDHQLAMPEAMGGSGKGTNPEQLFAAGYSACFHGALKLAAGEKKVSLPGDSQIDAEVGIGPDGESYAVNATLTVRLPGMDQETADALAERAHELCPYSKATRGNIDVTVTAVTS